MNVAKDAAEEIPEEVLTTVLQDLSSKYESVSPDMTLRDFIGNASDTVVQTVTMAGMGNVADATKITKNKLVSALNAFRRKPSSTNYEAAVDAGLPPIDNPNRKERSKYADTLNQPVQIPSTPTPSDATGAAPGVAQAPMAPMALGTRASANVAGITASANGAGGQEAPSVEDFSPEEQILSELEQRTKRHEEVTPQTEGFQQGWQEGLLTTPASTQAALMPTPQTSRIIVPRVAEQL